jgi:hypothetical protein
MAKVWLITGSVRGLAHHIAEVVVAASARDIPPQLGRLAVITGVTNYLGYFTLKRAVGEAQIGKQAQDATVAARLWNVSEKHTGMRWPPESVSCRS